MARLLVLMAAIAGSSMSTIMKILYSGGSGTQALPPLFITACRFSFNVLFANLWKGARAVLIPREASARSVAPSGLNWAAAELGAVAVLETVLKMYGLQHASTLTSESLLASVHLWIPVLTVAFEEKSSFGGRTWAGCTLSFASALFATIVTPATAGSTSTVAAASSPWSIAVGAHLLSSFVNAVGRVRTQRHLQTFSPEELNTARFSWMSLIAVLASMADAAAGGASSNVMLSQVAYTEWLLMALSVFLSSFVATSLLMSAQTVLSAASAQPILATQPLFAALFARLLLGEPITHAAMVGGVFITLGGQLASTDRVTLVGSSAAKKAR